MKATDTGIFLQRTAYSDSSLIVTFYTRSNGLQKFVFRGGKKKAHNIFPLSLSELTFYGRKESDLLNLTKVESLAPQTFQFNPVKSAVAFFLAETMRKCVAPGQSDPDFYQFMEEAISELEETDDLVLFPLQFMVSCSQALGFMPLCEDAEMTVFNLDAGTFQHTFSNTDRTYRGASVDLIKSLILGTKPETTAREQREEALSIMLNYFSIHVPRFDQLESYAIVQEVLRG